MGNKQAGKLVSRIGVIVVNSALALGALIPFVIDVLVNHQPTWSMYVLGAVAMIWVVTAPWMTLRRGRFMASWAAALITVPAYLYLVETISPAKGWFLPLGLPAALIGLAGVGAAGWAWLYSRLKPWYAAALTLLIAAVVNFGEFQVAHAFVQTDPLVWAHYLTSIALIALGALCGMIALSAHGANLIRAAEDQRDSRS